MKQNYYKEINLAADDLLVFTCVRNELARLPFFLEYYRSKGVDKFFFVDNASSDGTTKYLLSQDDVFLFKTNSSYASCGYGVNWIEILLKRYGVGRWCLLVDADELFIYPHFEILSMKQLCHFLEREGKNGVRALMLDMYANGFPALKENMGKHIWQVFPYFDKYDKNPHYRRKLFFENVAMIHGGVRKRVFGADACLEKTSLIKYSENHRLAASTHYITNINSSLLVECALFHFKFDSHFAEKVREEAGREEHWSNAKEYKQYARAFDICPTLNLHSSKHSIRYKNSQQLVEAGLMKSSHEYEMYVLSKSTGSTSVMILGVGSFAHSLGQTLVDAGANVSTYLTRNYGHFSPTLVGETFSRDAFPNPVSLIREKKIDVVIPQSIDWALQPWAKDLIKSGVGIFSPIGEAMRIERERDFARELCAKFKIPFPKSFVASNRIEAEKILAKNPQPFVIKNPLCSPTSPIHTILCETVADTRAWLRNVNYAEGVFLQEYLGRAEAGHIALVSGGEIHSLVTNQEYKYAFNGNMGIVAGAPLGGLVERDENDKYGLARELIHPLKPWLRESKFNGPLQVTAIKRGGKWHVIEYNIRIGVTSGPMILRMLKNPAETVLRIARNEKLKLAFNEKLNFGCSLTLVGYGYPFTQVRGPQLPLEVDGKFDCDVWWNEVARGADGKLFSTGHRIADVIALAPKLDAAISKAYANIRKIRVVGSYFRTDVGQSLWPPGNV